jgi:tetratricopeptide (TPR) repeat protein
MTQLRSVDHEDALRLEVQVRNRLVRFGSRTGMDDDELAQLLAAGRVLAEQVDDPRLQAELAAASGTAVLWRGHIAEALEEYRRSLALAQSVDDTERALVALVSLSVIRRWTGPTTDGLEHAEQVVRLTGGDPKVGVSLWGFGFVGLGLLFQAEHLRLTGDRTAARNRADQATRVLRNQSELEWLAWSLALDADLAETVVEFDSALAHATEALGIADDSANSANRVVALRAQGVSLNGLGRFDEAAAALTQGLTEARTGKLALFEEGVLLTHLSVACLGAGHLAEAAATADEAVEVARRQGAAIVECHAHLVRARVGRASGAPVEEVAADVATGLDLVAQTGAVIYEADLHELA